VNAYLLSLIALDVARERTRQAEHHWLEANLIEAQPERVSTVRRGTARLLAAVSIGSASIVRRLDSCVADDLGRTLSAAE
jgi:hypothetical protein